MEKLNIFMYKWNVYIKEFHLIGKVTKVELGTKEVYLGWICTFIYLILLLGRN
jgi:hypothetical protein